MPGGDITPAMAPPDSPQSRRERQATPPQKQLATKGTKTQNEFTDSEKIAHSLSR